METATIPRSTAHEGSGDGSRFPVHRNPLRLAASASPWRSAWYLTGHLAAGTVLAATAALAASAARAHASVARAMLRDSTRP